MCECVHSSQIVHTIIQNYTFSNRNENKLEKKKKSTETTFCQFLLYWSKNLRFKTKWIKEKYCKKGKERKWKCWCWFSDDLLTSSDSFCVCCSSGWTPSTASNTVTGLAGVESDSTISDTSLSENHCIWRLLSFLKAVIPQERKRERDERNKEKNN